MVDTKKSLIKKLLITCVVACLTVMSFAACFADSGEEAFVAAIHEQISADTMWGAVIPVVSIIGFVFTFAFAYRIVKRVLKKGSQGKFGM